MNIFLPSIILCDRTQFEKSLISQPEDKIAKNLQQNSMTGGGKVGSPVAFSVSGWR
jgi:hypothetical protein